ncbi:ESX-1 secretion-associated protein [Mycobacterium sp. Aquia_213]|uniref:ESX-1 secretion-associated protein n=1 Tax=Mycobacterium sp. Aquia_213 TaxID=2991728 RepID=UPI00226FB410|nr:ESX-1 secretion-associated protein [Mycobacterium sp. Aquia_213]WAC93367.1 ESX-1 secretion-associated protein [Mycobacterium sp. Aquia_213]
MNDLAVTAGYLDILAEQQNKTAEQIGAAASVATEAKTSVWVSHGVASFAFNIAVVKAESARRALGAEMKRVATNFDAKLHTAEGAYAATDTRAAENLDKILHG